MEIIYQTIEKVEDKNILIYIHDTHIGETNYIPILEYENCRFKIYWNGDDKVVFKMYHLSISKIDITYYIIEIKDIVEEQYDNDNNNEYIFIPWNIIFNSDIIYGSPELYQLRKILQN